MSFRPKHPDNLQSSGERAYYFFAAKCDHYHLVHHIFYQFLLRDQRRKDTFQVDFPERFDRSSVKATRTIAAGRAIAEAPMEWTCLVPHIGWPAEVDPWTGRCSTMDYIIKQI